MTARVIFAAGSSCRRLDHMPADQLPCLALLDATPQILAALLSDVSEEDARWKPAADRFGIAEVLAHMSHSETNCYRQRLDRFLAEDRPKFEPDDAQMWLDLYRDTSASQSFQQFRKQRQMNVDFLRSLSPVVGFRPAIHQEAGPITLSHMLHEWALHDLGHVRQITELVRARKYFDGAGPLGMYYQLKP